MRVNTDGTPLGLVNIVSDIPRGNIHHASCSCVGHIILQKRWELVEKCQWRYMADFWRRIGVGIWYADKPLSEWTTVVSNDQQGFGRGVYGFWTIAFEEPKCETRWGEFNDKVCSNVPVISPFFIFSITKPRLFFAGLFRWFRSPRKCSSTSNDDVREDSASGTGSPQLRYHRLVINSFSASNPDLKTSNPGLTGKSCVLQHRQKFRADVMVVQRLVSTMWAQHAVSERNKTE